MHGRLQPCHLHPFGARNTYYTLQLRLGTGGDPDPNRIFLTVWALFAGCREHEPIVDLPFSGKDQGGNKNNK